MAAEPPENDCGDTDPRWARAVTLAQLGQLVAEWLEGRISVPIQADSVGPDSETAALTLVLAHLNRSGFVTNNSQPGEIDGDWAQRAAVSGYCDEDVAERLASISVRTDLIAISQPAGLEAPYQLPITREGNYTFTILCGDHEPTAEDEDVWPWPGLRPDLRSALRSAWHVDVCDPVWGRNDVLWPALAAAMSQPVDDVRGSLIDPTRFEQEDSP